MSQRSAISGKKSVMNPIDYSGVVQSRMLAPATESTVPDTFAPESTVPDTVAPISSDLLSPYTGEGGGEVGQSMVDSMPEESYQDKMASKHFSDMYSKTDIGLGLLSAYNSPFGLFDTIAGGALAKSRLKKETDIQMVKDTGDLMWDLDIDESLTPKNDELFDKVSLETAQGKQKEFKSLSAQGIKAGYNLLTGAPSEDRYSAYQGMKIDEALGYKQPETTLGTPTFEADPTLDIGVNTYAGDDGGYGDAASQAAAMSGDSGSLAGLSAAGLSGIGGMGGYSGYGGDSSGFGGGDDGGMSGDTEGGADSGFGR